MLIASKLIIATDRVRSILRLPFLPSTVLLNFIYIGSARTAQDEWHDEIELHLGSIKQ